MTLIELHEKQSGNRVFIHAEKIVKIEDHTITLTNGSISVQETDEDVLFYLRGSNNILFLCTNETGEKLAERDRFVQFGM